MTDILKELFESPLYGGCNPSDTLRALQKKENELWDRLLPVIGLETIDEINNTQGEIAREIDLQWFREGFRLGASLMLELL
ncbi:MAG: hypothetical protein K2O45_16775 [Oscillospiraceae bacterium]|nr:hypothetical protein [Oscillospiraceae bacterium]